MSRKNRKGMKGKPQRVRAECPRPTAAPPPHRGRVPLVRIDDWRWRIPQTGAMLVDGLVYASAAQVESLSEDAALRQVANVATIPGIVGHSFATPDIHWGDSFPIGGAAAFDPEAGGVVSPGGGSGINGSVRLLAGDIDAQARRPRGRASRGGGRLARLLGVMYRRRPRLPSLRRPAGAISCGRRLRRWRCRRDAGSACRQDACGTGARDARPTTPASRSPTQRFEIEGPLARRCQSSVVRLTLSVRCRWILHFQGGV